MGEGWESNWGAKKIQHRNSKKRYNGPDLIFFGRSIIPLDPNTTRQISLSIKLVSFKSLVLQSETFSDAFSEYDVIHQAKFSQLDPHTIVAEMVLVVNRRLALPSLEDSVEKVHSLFQWVLILMPKQTGEYLV